MSGLPALRCFIFFAAVFFILVYPSFNIHRLSWPSQMGQWPPVLCRTCSSDTHLARRLSGPPLECMRECTHFVKAEQPRNLGYLQLRVIKVSNRQIAPQLSAARRRRARGRGDIAATGRLQRLAPAAFAAAVFGLTLVLRLALAAGRAPAPRAWSAGVRPGRVRGRRTSTSGARGAQLGRASCSTASPSSCPALPVHAAGHPPGLLLVCGLGSTRRAGSPRRASPPARSASRSPTPRPRAARRAARARRRAADALAPGAAAVRRHVRGRPLPGLGLLAAWPLAAPRPPRAARRRGARGRHAVRAGPALAVGAWAALIASSVTAARTAIALGLVRGTRSVGVPGGSRRSAATTRSGRCARPSRSTGSASRPSALRVLAARLARGVPARARDPPRPGSRYALSRGRDTAARDVPRHRDRRASRASRRPRSSGSGSSSRRWPASPPRRAARGGSRPVLAVLAVQALACELAWHAVW